MVFIKVKKFMAETGKNKFFIFIIITILINFLFMNNYAAGSDISLRERQLFVWSKLSDPCVQSNSYNNLLKLYKSLGSVLKIEDEYERDDELNKLLTATKKLPAKCFFSQHATFLLADIFYHIENYQSAEDLYYKTLKLDKGELYTDLIYFNLAIIESKRLNFEKAITYYNNSLKYPANREIRSIIFGNIAETSMAAGNLKTANEQFNISIKLMPQYAGSWWGLAVLKDKEGDNFEAIRLAKIALGLGNGIEELTKDEVFYIPVEEEHYYLGLAFEAEGDNIKAIEQWELYIEKTKNNNNPWLQRAVFHLNKLKKSQ